MFVSNLILLTLASACLAPASAPDSDASAHVLHPHRIVPRSDGHLAGHKEQLGWQRPPVGPVFKYAKTPSPRELWEHSVKPYRPALIRGALEGSPSLLKWDDKYLVDEFGDQEVLVEKKYEDRKSSPKRMILKDFLSQYRDQNWYVVSMLPNAMRRDCKVPKPLMCGTFRKNLAELNLWIGTRGTRSVLHYDADNILHCVVSGRKDWILIHPDYKPKLDMVTNRRGQGSGFSHINVDSVDENIHTEVWDVPWEYVTLYAGDCLYLPPQYLHQVRSYNRSISTTFLFYPQSTFSDDSCSGVDLDQYLSLSDVYVYWTYEKNQETVDMGYMNPVTIRLETLSVLNATGISLMDERLFTYLALIMHAEPVPEVREHIRRLFAVLDENEDNFVSKAELTDADMEIWKQWCRDLDSPHGPTKSELAESEKASSKTAEFLPRHDDRHADARNAYYFLHFLIRVKGGNGRIVFPEFKKWLRLEKGTAADAFILFDADFNGVLTIKELRKSYRKRFREFSRMKYLLEGTTIGGGGLYSDEIEDLSFLEKLEDIPVEHLATEEQDEEDENERSMNKTLNEFFVRFEKFLGDQPNGQADINQFKELLETSDLQQSFGVINFDTRIFFNVIDRGQKGFILLDDVEHYRMNRLCKEWQISMHGVEERESVFYPNEVLFRIFSLMDSAHSFINYEEEEENEPELQQSVKGVKNMKTHNQDDSEDSGDSEDEGSSIEIPEKSEL